MVAKNNGPVSLSDALRTFLEKSDVGERIEEAAVVPEWADRVGPAIAAVTTPVKVSRGTLVVAVRSSPWLMELRLIERDIIKRINIGRERGKIRAIRFVMAEEAPASAPDHDGQTPRQRPGNP